MSGSAIIRYLLVNNGALIAEIPATRIECGDLPMNVILPAISIKKIDGRQNNNVAMTSDDYLVTERIQVTVLAKNYLDLQDLMPLIRAAIPLHRSSASGYDCRSIIPDIEGPELYNHAMQVRSESADFMVSFVR